MSSISLQDRLNNIPSSQTVDDWNHRVFLATNETMQEKTLQILGKKELNGNAMLGVSGFFLLNAAAVRPGDGIDTLILVDNSKRVADFWAEMKSIIEKATNRKEVVQKAKELLTRNATEYFSGESDVPNDSLKEQLFLFDLEMNQRLSWLSSNEKFERIQKIFKSSGFAFKSLDLSDTAAVETLVSTLSDAGVKLDSVYISNVALAMHTQTQKESFRSSMDKLLQPGLFTILVKPQSCSTHVLPEQHIIKRADQKAIPEGTFFPPSEDCQDCINNAPPPMRSTATVRAGTPYITYNGLTIPMPNIQPIIQQSMGPNGLILNVSFKAKPS